jgi:anti-sigma-K factor RskA
MTDHRAIIELIPAYALHALDEDEARRVAAHLAICADCRDELAAYEATAARLASAAPPAEPPAYVKDRLMARIGPGVRPAPPVEHRPSWWERLRAVMRASAPVWAPVSAALILILLVSNILLWRQVSRSPNPQVVTVALAGTDAAPGANGVLAFTPGQPEGVLVVSDLAPLPAEQQYQLWLIDDAGNRDSGAVFSVDAAGRARVDVAGGEALPTYAAFGVTVEPAGGSPGPTGQKVLGSDL